MATVRRRILPGNSFQKEAVIKDHGQLSFWAQRGQRPSGFVSPCALITELATASTKALPMEHVSALMAHDIRGPARDTQQLKGDGS